MLRGLCNVSFWADDVVAAVRWYREVLGIEPYFARPEQGPPAYVEFRLGDSLDELGIIDRRYAPSSAQPGPGGVIAYWHVDDVRTTYGDLLARGAREYDPPTDRGEAGWVIAAVVDPFGNILGLMHSPHYLEILGSTR